MGSQFDVQDRFPNRFLSGARSLRPISYYLRGLNNPNSGTFFRQHFDRLAVVGSDGPASTYTGSDFRGREFGRFIDVDDRILGEQSQRKKGARRIGAVVLFDETFQDGEFGLLCSKKLESGLFYDGCVHVSLTRQAISTPFQPAR
jgi:hypothetical protein